MAVRRAFEIGFAAAWLGAGALAACGDDDVVAALDDAGVDATVIEAEASAADCRTYPSGPYGVTTNEVLADLELPSGNGSDPVRLSALRRCERADAPSLIVLRVAATFCGTCRYSAEHSKELMQPRVQLVDVLVRGDEGGVPTVADATRWAARRDVEVPTVLDPENHFRDADPALILPTFLFVDARTMQVESVLTNPEVDAVVHREAQLLAVIDGEPRIPPVSFPRHDGFAANEWSMIQAMAQPANFAPPPDPTDRHADDPRAAALGAVLFEDAEFSANGRVSCKTCHDPAHAFTDGLRTGEGVGIGDRNSQSLMFAAHQPWQFWDGRVDTLWAQALGPLENELEFGSTRLAVVHRLATTYRAELEAVYGPMPDFSDPLRFPARGKPGQPAWEAMADDDRRAVTQVFVWMGKAIAAFERTLRAEDNALDRYARGDVDALTVDQKLGLRAFFTAGCAQCHYGPRLTDDAFHIVRFPTGRADGAADVGRSEGLRLYAAAEFGAASQWSDVVRQRPESLALLGQPMLVGQFKTPSLRGAAVTAPYGHGGSEGDVFVVTATYRDGGLAATDPRAIGETDPWVPQFDMHAQHEIAAFLQILTAVRRAP